MVVGEGSPWGGFYEVDRLSCGQLQFLGKAPLCRRESERTRAAW
jgi:hypothetical protein